MNSWKNKRRAYSDNIATQSLDQNPLQISLDNSRKFSERSSNISYDYIVTCNNKQTIPEIGKKKLAKYTLIGGFAGTLVTALGGATIAAIACGTVTAKTIATILLGALAFSNPILGGVIVAGLIVGGLVGYALWKRKKNGVEEYNRYVKRNEQTVGIRDGKMQLLHSRVDSTDSFFVTHCGSNDETPIEDLTPN